MKKSSNKNIIITIIVVIVLAVIGFFVFRSDSSPSPKEELAQCLTEKGATFYGAYWCPHCNNQKLAFGRSASKKLNYVECAIFPTEVNSITKNVLKEYNAGTYTGAYLEALDAAKEANELDQWEPTQTEACVSAEITGYPTWVFADGSRENGEVPLPKLAEKSGCEYVN